MYDWDVYRGLIPEPVALWIKVVLLCQAGYVTGIGIVTLHLLLKESWHYPSQAERAWHIVLMALSHMIFVWATCASLWQGFYHPLDWQGIAVMGGYVLTDFGLYRLLKARYVRQLGGREPWDDHFSC